MLYISLYFIGMFLWLLFLMHISLRNAKKSAKEIERTVKLQQEQLEEFLKKGDW